MLTRLKRKSGVRYSQAEDDLKNKDNLKNGNDLKSGEALTKEDIPKRKTN